MFESTGPTTDADPLEEMGYINAAELDTAILPDLALSSGFLKVEEVDVDTVCDVGTGFV